MSNEVFFERWVAVVVCSCFSLLFFFPPTKWPIVRTAGGAQMLELVDGDSDCFVNPEVNNRDGIRGHMRLRSKRLHVSHHVAHMLLLFVCVLSPSSEKSIREDGLMAISQIKQ